MDSFQVAIFLFSFLKASHDVSFLSSFGTIFQIFGSRKKILFVPQKHFLHLANQIEKTVVNSNHYSLVEIIVSR